MGFRTRLWGRRPTTWCENRLAAGVRAQRASQHGNQSAATLVGWCMRRHLLVTAATTAAALLATAGSAGACGGLVGENGSIQLARTSTLAAWADGVETYVTSFEFTGSGDSVGSIIPLPGVPTDVVAAGDWTLQRLQQEVAPPEVFAATAGSGDAAASREAEVLLETTVDALDITVLRGGGDEVGQWALNNGFFLSPDAPEVLDFYAERSPIFLAAKFDASRAAEQGLTSGQGTPISISIPLDRPWVPLRILGLGLDAATLVQADVFLLTPDEPDLLAGGDGLVIERSLPASPQLLADLRSDQNTEWVQDQMWLTHLTLDEQAGDLRYDLATSVDSAAASVRDAGLLLPEFDRTSTAVDPAGNDSFPTTGQLALATGVALLAAAGIGQVLVARRVRRS